MESKQYRITKFALDSGTKYTLQVTHGLCDTEVLGVYTKQADARAVAKDHAARRNVKPIILTGMATGSACASTFSRLARRVGMDQT